VGKNQASLRSTLCPWSLNLVRVVTATSIIIPLTQIPLPRFILFCPNKFMHGGGFYENGEILDQCICMEFFGYWLGCFLAIVRVVMVMKHLV
jgi:hypothetical protein